MLTVFNMLQELRQTIVNMDLKYSQTNELTKMIFNIENEIERRVEEDEEKNTGRDSSIC